VVDWTRTQAGTEPLPALEGPPSCRFERPEASDAEEQKVGTKLIAVLVAPVLVLVILASIGVSQAPRHGQQRPAGRATGPDGRCRRQPGQRDPARGRLSAAYMASGGKGWSAELATQRKATDAAKDTYNTTLARSTRARTPTT